MSTPVRHLYRQIRTSMRILKRNFPSDIMVYHLLSQTADGAIGKTTKTWQQIPVTRAIALPAKETRDFVYDLSYIASNKNFTMGALFDTAVRAFIIDRDDIPTDVTLKKNDYLTQDGQRWDVVEVIVSAELRFIAPLCRRIDDMPANDIFHLSGADVLGVSENG